jgi:hypothetical protein
MKDTARCTVAVAVAVALLYVKAVILSIIKNTNR